MLKIALVPTWRNAWKWMSVQAAALEVLLGAVQTISQEFAADGYLAEMTHKGWYHFLMTIVGMAIIVLRQIHQPVVVPTEGDPK